MPSAVGEKRDVAAGQKWENKRRMTDDDWNRGLNTWRAACVVGAWDDG